MWAEMTLGLAVWEADVMGRTRTIILDLRWRLIPALHWPLIEKVCQLLVYLIASILFKPLYFEVSLLQQLSLYLEYLSGLIMFHAPLCSFHLRHSSFPLLPHSLTILLATGPLPVLFLLPGMYFFPSAWLILPHPYLSSGGQIPHLRLSQYHILLFIMLSKLQFYNNVHLCRVKET